jgi:molybdenum ABC transporter molybdate-binding protein
MKWLLIFAMLLVAGCLDKEDDNQQAVDKVDRPDSTAQAPDQADGAAQDSAAASEVPADLAEGVVVVLSDASLKTPLEALAGGFAKKHGPGWYLDFAERDEITTLLSGDAAAGRYDAVLTDKLQMDALVAAGKIETGTNRTFAGDRLALVSSASGPEWKPKSFFDLHRLRFKGLGIGEPTTIAGVYSDQALQTSGSLVRVADRLIKYPSTNAMFDGLLKDEVQMAFVPSSVAAQRTDLKIVLVIEETNYEDLRYQAAAVSGHAEKAGVMPLLVYLAENADVQQKLMGYGLEDRVQAMKETQ